MKRPVSLCLLLITLSAPLLAAQLADAPPVTRYDNHRLVEVTLSTPADQQTMQGISPLFLPCVLGLGPQQFVVSPEKMDALVASGLPFRVLSENVQGLIDAEAATLTQRGGPWFDSYHNYADIEAYVDSLVALRPDIATKINLGNSLQGRAIFGIQITGPDGPAGKRGLMFNACQHAREWISPPVTMYVADQLIRNYGVDAELTEIVDELVTYVAPISNPDGYVYTWTSDRLWRKNRRNNGDGSFGVDTNRNWGYFWGGAGSDSFGSSEVYRGTAPFSEPETQALRNFVLAHSELRAHIDFHSYSQLILSPWGYVLGQPDDPDGATFAMLNTAMQSAIEDVHGEDYTAGPIGTTLYLASGGAVDWVYGAAGVKSWTIELRPDTDFPGFQLPASEIRATCEENFAAVRVLTDYVLNLVTFTYPSELPEEVNPAVATTIDLVIDGPVQAGSERLYTRFGDSGPFTPQTLVSLGDGDFQGTLPAADCGAPIQYYFEVTRTDGSTATDPPGAPASVYSTVVGDISDVFVDHMETNPGWTVSNTSVSDGAWDRGVPVDCDRGDPPSDYDGSGQCWLTDNSAANGCNSDLDGGPTRLLSPVLDLSAPGEYSLHYARWFSNDDEDADRLTVEISNNNGGSWTLVESVGNTGGWGTREFQVSDYVTPTSQVRVRFSATDNPNDSVTEAGVDDFRVRVVTCTPPAPCPGDLDHSGTIDLTDLSVQLANYGVPSGATADDGDLDGDGDVDLTDLSLLLAGYGTSCP